ncbi:unnamed protein product [Amoebophrya sp. A25]|nr:unnamed protein product [Amoebophrya sp. A25]|eukprot:GSA25T00009119001.1
MEESHRKRIFRARRYLREFLGQIHILDMLVERGNVVTVDVSLKFHAVISAILEYGHHHASSWSPPDSSRHAAAEQQPHLLADSAGLGSPGLYLPSNVLSEVGVFTTQHRKRTSTPVCQSQLLASANASAVISVVEDQSQCRLIQPLTVGEVACFLTELRRRPELSNYSLEQWRSWHAKKRSGSSSNVASKAGTSCGSAANVGGGSAVGSTAASEMRPSQVTGGSESSSSSKQKSLPTALSSSTSERASSKVVVYHVDESTPARPILCVDDKESTVLRAIELLLQFPDLNALPIVNPERATVVAHVTLAQLLAYTAIHVRSPEMAPLGDISITSSGGMGEVSRASRAANSAMQELSYRFVGEKRPSGDNGGGGGSTSSTTGGSSSSGSPTTNKGTTYNGYGGSTGQSQDWRVRVVKRHARSTSSGDLQSVTGQDAKTGEGGGAREGGSTRNTVEASSTPGAGSASTSAPTAGDQQQETSSSGDAGPGATTAGAKAAGGAKENSTTGGTSTTSSTQGTPVDDGNSPTTGTTAAESKTGNGKSGAVDPGGTQITVVQDTTALEHVLAFFSSNEDLTALPVVTKMQVALSPGRSPDATDRTQEPGKLPSSVGSPQAIAAVPEGSPTASATAGTSSATSSGTQDAGGPNKNDNDNSNANDNNPTSGNKITSSSSSGNLLPTSTTAHSSTGPTSARTAQEGGSSSSQYVLVGAISRRQVLQYLDLCMQDALDQFVEKPLIFNLASPVKEVLDVLVRAQKHQLKRQLNLPPQHLWPGSHSFLDPSFTKVTALLQNGRPLDYVATVIGKPVVTLRDLLPLVLSDRSARVMFVEKQLLTRVYTAGDALHALLYDETEQGVTAAS